MLSKGSGLVSGLFLYVWGAARTIWENTMQKRTTPQNLPSLGNIQVTATPAKARQSHVKAGNPGSSALRLAQALQSVQPALESYIKKDVAKTEAEMNAQFGGMTLEESEKYYQAGLEEHSGLYKVALNKQFGIRMASEHHRMISEKVAAGEIDILQAGNVERAIFEHRNSLGKEPATEMLNAYDNSMSSFTQKLRVEAATAQGKKRLQDRDDNFAATLHNIATDFDHRNEIEDDDVQGFMDIVKQMKATNGKGSDLNMSNSSFNDIFLNFAKVQAGKGNEAIVKAILEMPNGEAPSLLQSNLHGQIAASILDTAKTNKEKLMREDFDSIFVQHHELASQGLWTRQHQRAMEEQIRSLGYSGRQMISMMKIMTDTQEGFHDKQLARYIAKEKFNAAEGALDTPEMQAKVQDFIDNGADELGALKLQYSLVQTHQAALDKIKRENIKKRKAQNLLAAEKAALNEAERLFDSGLANEMTGGISVTIGEGEEAQTFNLTQPKAEQAVMDKKLGEIARRYQNDPQASLMAQVEFLADNGAVVNEKVKGGIEDAVMSLTRWSKDEDFDPSQHPAGMYLQVYESLRLASPVVANEYAGENRELLNTFLANRNFHGDWSKGVKQTLMDLERAKNGNMEFAGLDRALVMDSGIEGFQRSIVYAGAKNYMKFNGGDERAAIKQAKQDFEENFKRFGDTDTYYDVRKLPTYINPLSGKKEKLNEAGIEKLRTEFEHGYMKWHEEAFNSPYDPDKLRIVQIAGTLTFTYNNNFIDDAFQDDLIEEGRVKHADITALMRRANQHNLEEIKAEREKRKSGRKSVTGGRFPVPRN